MSLDNNYYTYTHTNETHRVFYSELVMCNDIFLSSTMCDPDRKPLTTVLSIFYGNKPSLVTMTLLIN